VGAAVVTDGERVLACIPGRARGRRISYVDEFDIRDRSGLTPEQVSRGVDELLADGRLLWRDGRGFYVAAGAN